MKPLIISGTCKELYNCEKILKRCGYSPDKCYLKTADNHDSGFIVINRHGEFTFFAKNPHPEYDHIVTAPDFLKNYGTFGIKTCYTPKNIYTVVSLVLLFTGLEMSNIYSSLALIGIAAVNIPLHWQFIKNWFQKLN